MTDKTGGPAFPQLDCYVNADGSKPVYVSYNGMTLRDYFAAKAMHAYLVSFPENRPSMEIFAKSAYEMADSMLKEREK